MLKTQAVAGTLRERRTRREETIHEEAV